MYIRDTENTVMYTPSDYTGNKFFGTWNKALLIQNNLFSEAREKYYNNYTAQLKAEAELESIPKCFSCCVNDFSTGLNSREKNCMSDCYFKRVSSRDDLNMLV